MYLKIRLLAVAIAFTFVSLISVTHAQDSTDTSTLGIIKAEAQAKEYLKNNKLAPPLVISNEIIAALFDKDFPYKILNEGKSPEVGELAMSSIDYKFNIVNEVRNTMLEVAKDKTDNIFRLWLDKEKELCKKILDKAVGKPQDSQILNSFLEQWLSEYTKVQSGESDKTKHNALFISALEQGAYQITAVAVGVQAEQEKISVATAPVNSAGRSSAGGKGVSGSGSGNHRADVFHARVMSGIYRHHRRHSNQIERITARR